MTRVATSPARTGPGGRRAPAAAGRGGLGGAAARLPPAPFAAPVAAPFAAPFTPGRRGGAAGRCGAAVREEEVGGGPAPAREELEALEAQLAAAVADEDYRTAASLRDRLRAKRLEDPAYRLEEQLREAVEGEDYAAAARLRDSLEKVLASRREAQRQTVEGVGTSSECTSQGLVRVAVQSFYVPSKSAPSEGQFFFAYKVQIENVGLEAVRLVSRHWIITYSDGSSTEVKGPGVIGEQPVLEPGELFEYTSACQMQGAGWGTMEGSYEMERLDAANTSFNAKIASFLCCSEASEQL